MTEYLNQKESRIKISPRHEEISRVIVNGSCTVSTVMLVAIYWQGIMNGGTYTVYAQSIPIAFFGGLVFYMVMVTVVAFLTYKVMGWRNA